MGHADVGSNLVAFLPLEKYLDSNNNGNYDAGERVYRDMDGNGQVSVNDVRLGSFVSGGNQFATGLVLAGEEPSDGLPLEVEDAGLLLQVRERLVEIPRAVRHPADVRMHADRQDLRPRLPFFV